jgi:uncharacterized ion transporter superfamily protein YfcC
MSVSTLKVPHTLVLLMGMIVLAWGAGWVLPQGQFQRVKNEQGRLVVQPGTYQRLEAPAPLPPATLLTAVPRGLAAAQAIIFFVFIIGGAIAVIRATGAIDAALGLALRTFGKHRGLLIGAGILLFAAGSSTLGMSAEYIPLVPLLLALCLAMRLDAMTAVGIMVVGYGVGYGIAAINPFTLVVAQTIAELPPTSGLWYRLLLVVPFVAVGFHHVHRYAERVAADAGKSLVAGIEPPSFARTGDYPPLGVRHGVVLALTAGAVGLLVFGIVRWGWYLEEMGAMFLGLTVLVAVAGKLGPDRVGRKFTHGATEMTATALLIGFARTIQLLLEEGMVIDTVVNAVAQPLMQMGPSFAAVGMFAFQSLLNLFVPSGSGQAYVTMPLMVPIADLTGVPRQVAVLAFLFGDGFTNILVPTNAVLMGILGLAKIPYDRWLRFVLPLMVKLWVVGAVALVVAVWIGYR